jgi:hypothetical protein
VLSLAEILKIFWLEVGITRHNFESWPPKDHSYHVCFKLTYWFQRRWLLNIFSIWCYVKTKSSTEQNWTKLARNVYWMVIYEIFVFGADLKSNMAAMVHNVFSLAEILKIF